MKLSRKVLTALSVAVFACIVAVSVGLVWFQHQGGRLYSIQTGSMEPGISPGGMVAIRPVEPASLRVGDVVTYVSPENRNVTITHRIIELEESAQSGRTIITTQGDANAVPDQPVSDALVVGRMSFYVPFAGAVLDFVRNPLGLLALIYVPALTVMIAEIRKLQAYYKSREPYFYPSYAKHR